jgi:hypothetical protein
MGYTEMTSKRNTAKTPTTFSLLLITEVYTNMKLYEPILDLRMSAKKKTLKTKSRKCNTLSSVESTSSLLGFESEMTLK